MEATIIENGTPLTEDIDLSVSFLHLHVHLSRRSSSNEWATHLTQKYGSKTVPSHKYSIAIRKKFVLLCPFRLLSSSLCSSLKLNWPDKLNIVNNS